MNKHLKFMLESNTIEGENRINPDVIREEGIGSFCFQQPGCDGSHFPGVLFGGFPLGFSQLSDFIFFPEFLNIYAGNSGVFKQV